MCQDNDPRDHPGKIMVIDNSRRGGWWLDPKKPLEPQREKARKRNR